MTMTFSTHPCLHAQACTHACTHTHTQPLSRQKVRQKEGGQLGKNDGKEWNNQITLVSFQLVSLSVTLVHRLSAIQQRDI